MNKMARNSLTRVAVSMARLVYWPVQRLVPTRDKIVFISRQENRAPLDLQLISDAFRTAHPAWEQVMLTKRLDSSWIRQLLYIFHVLRQMIHIAGARVVVLDSYCIAVSVLRHSPNVQIVQMWHALGALKRFAYSVIDGPDGADDEFANIMHMHENYDRVLASAPIARHAFAEAFNTDIDRVVVHPLPRVDLLRNAKHQAEMRERVFTAHPSLRGQHIALLAPTFRTTALSHIRELQAACAARNIHLIIKGHPFVDVTNTVQQRLEIDDFTAFDLLSVADAVITDYSSIVFEAAVLGKELYFYAPDLDCYATTRNFYIDYREEMPGLITDSPHELAEAVLHHESDLEKVRAFAERYVAPTQHATEDIVDMLTELATNPVTPSRSSTDSSAD